MINYLKITNFKMFESLELKFLTPITIIGGANNIGKTTLLEAIFFFYDRWAPDIAIIQLIQRGMIETPSILADPCGYLFHRYQTDKKIELILRDEVYERLLVSYNPNAPVEMNVEQGLKNIVVSRNTAQSLHLQYSQENIKQQKRTLKKDVAQEIQWQDQGISQTFFARPKLHVEHKNKKNILSKQVRYIFASSHSTQALRNNAELFSVIEIQNKNAEIIQALQMIEPRLTSLATVIINDTPYIYGDVGLEKKIPLAFMGEGMVRLFSIVVSIIVNPGGIILIDEIENGFHHSLHTKIWEMLLKLSRQYHCQIFITTHSYEILRAMRKSEKVMQAQDYISYIRLDREEDKDSHQNYKIIPKYYSLDILGTALEENWEVR